MAKEVVEKKKTVIVEKVETSPAPTPTHKTIEGRVSGSHKVKFQPNGNTVGTHNGRRVSLGEDVKLIAATTAQVLVDKGLGVIVE
jgi:hypothetical protein